MPEGKLIDEINRGKVSVLVFETANGVVEVSVFNDKKPSLEIGRVYDYETKDNIGRDGRQYTNLRSIRAKEGGFVQASAVSAPKSPDNGYLLAKDKRISRLSLVSSSSAIVAEMRLLDAEKAMAMTLELAKAFEAWIYEKEEGSS